jgi:hypothetical protein
MKKLATTRAFTLPEITLAIGVVAFGLVAIFSILPFGLTAQKDNRDDTIIRLEAEFWKDWLLLNAPSVEDIRRVERVEVYQAPTGTTNTMVAAQRRSVFFNPFRNISSNITGASLANRVLLGYTQDSNASAVPNEYIYPLNSVALSGAQANWASDVGGWLLGPVGNSNLLASGHWGNFALVKSLNGSLFDRLYGAEPETEAFGYMERDFSMGYILQVEPWNHDDGGQVKISFYWPMFDEAKQAIKQNESLMEIVRSSKTQSPLIGLGLTVPRFNTKSFVIRTPRKIVPAILRSNLDLQERHVSDYWVETAQGGEVDVEGLSNDLAISYSYNTTTNQVGVVSLPRKVFNNGVQWGIQVRYNNQWVNQSAYPNARTDLSFVPSDFSVSRRQSQEWSVGRSGMCLYPRGLSHPNNEFSIAWVDPGQRPYFYKRLQTGTVQILQQPSDLPQDGFYSLNTTKYGQSWNELIGSMVQTNANRGQLLKEVDGRYYVACRVRETTHRALTPLEKALAGVSGWQWKPDEHKAPQLWRFE